MGREFRIQAALKEPFGLVPTMIGLCVDESVIGSEFYVMERIDGIIPRRDLPPEVELTEEQTNRLCRNALDTLISLHRVDVAAPDLAALGKGTVVQVSMHAMRGQHRPVQLAGGIAAIAECSARSLTLRRLPLARAPEYRIAQRTGSPTLATENADAGTLVGVQWRSSL